MSKQRERIISKLKLTILIKVFQKLFLITQSELSKTRKSFFPFDSSTSLSSPFISTSDVKHFLFLFDKPIFRKLRRGIVGWLKKDISHLISRPGVNPIKIEILKEYSKKWLFCNKLDCLLMRKICTCITNALAYHCKITENIL